MVHAGIPPNWSISESIQYAAEVEIVLRSDNYYTFFENMYGNQPDQWAEQLKGWDRLRLITNYLTRMRYCSRSGELELNHKTLLEPKGYAPWFKHKAKPDEFHKQPYSILFGHWAALEGQSKLSNVIALDTGCLWGRKLTTYRLEDKQFFSVPSQQS